MPEADDLGTKAGAARNLAARARRLAQGLGLRDRERLLHYAQELEAQASQLEAQVPAGAVRVVEQTQQQVQQQQGPSGTTDASSGSKST